MAPSDHEADAIHQAARSALHEFGHRGERLEGLAKIGLRPGQLLEPSAIQAFHAVAQFLMDRRDYARALTVAAYAVMIDPENEEAHYRVARCLQIHGEFKTAAELFLLPAGAGSAAAWLRLGECLKALEMPAEASAAFQQAVDAARGEHSLLHVQDAALSQLAA